MVALSERRGSGPTCRRVWRSACCRPAASRSASAICAAEPSIRGGSSPTRGSNPCASSRSIGGGRHRSHHASPGRCSVGVKKTAATSGLWQMQHWCGRWVRC
eukprot:4341227-Alexandrium_andersonii.AAC.2